MNNTQPTLSGQPSLPAYFILYIPNRTTGQFILVRTNVGDTGGYVLNPEPATNTQYRLIRQSPVEKPTTKFKVLFELADRTTVMKEIWDWTGILQIKMSSGLRISVLTIVGHSPIIGRGLAGNIQIQTAPSQQIPSPTLSSFIACQLLELAQLKHERCPITVEEFTAGNTAVLPCGHLFTRLAITESFKTVPNRCPACRITGVPVYV